MMSDYKLMRRTRPDGNCFFRAFAFAYFETLLNDPTELERFSQVATKTKNDLIKLGVLAFTVEDFHDNVSLASTKKGSNRSLSSFKESWTRFEPKKCQLLSNFWKSSMNRECQTTLWCTFGLLHRVTCS